MLDAVLASESPLDLRRCGGRDPAVVLALQRTAGNHAVSRLLGHAPATPATAAHASQRLLLRAPAPHERRAFAEQWALLEQKLRAAAALDGEDVKTVRRLWAAAQHDGWLKTEVPDVYRRLKKLHELEQGRSTRAPSEIVGAARADAEYSAVAAAIHHPSITGGEEAKPYKGKGGGEFFEPALASAEAEEKKRLIGAGVKPAYRTDLPTVDARINLALKEIDKAFHHHRAQPPPHGLKPEQVVLVYIGPEWYFRRPDRPYTREERDHVVRTFTASSRLYPDMVLMPGTIVSADWKPGGFADLTNTAPVALDGQLLTTVDKSDNCGDVAGLVTSSLFSAEARRRAGSSFFDVANLRFAIDICADHSAKRAREELKQLEGEDVLAKGGGVDVHLVTAAGQSPDPKSVATRPGGLNIGADTQARSGSATVRQTVGPGKTSEEQELAKEIAPAAELSVIDKPEPSPEELAKQYRNVDPKIRERFVRKKYHPAQTSYFAPVVVNVRTGEEIAV